MSDNLPPIVPRELRTRVAVPIAPPPVLRPSLIPHDVLQDVEREARKQEIEIEIEDVDEEPRTAPVPIDDEDIAILTHVEADPEVAIFALSQVSLFKDLPPESLEALAKGAAQIEIPDNDTLFVEGDDATSFFVVVDGTLELLRDKDGREVALRHVSQGEALGLFGLFAGQLRAASARAIGDCVVVEVSQESLQSVLNCDDALHNRLLRFYRERLLEGFMANKLFAEIDSIARARLLGRFVHKTIERGETLVQPGEVTNLLAVVTHGSLILEERTRAGQSRNFEVNVGQFLAATCAMSGLPSKLRIHAPEFCTVSILAQKDLNELLRDYPVLRALPQRLPAHARQLDRDVFCGTTGLPGL